MIPKLTEPYENDYNSFCRRIKENGLVLSDSDGLYWEPLLPIARDLGKEIEYRNFVKNSNLCYEDISKQIVLLKNYPIKRAEDKIGEAQLFCGARESIDAFKKYGLEVVVITDNPLAEVWRNTDAFRRKLGVFHINSTSRAETRDGKYTGRIEIPSKDLPSRTKPKIVDYYVEKYNPRKLVGIAQGENDIPLVKAVKTHGGYVFVVNSNSSKMSEMADTHIEHIGDAPEIIEKVLNEL